MGNLIQLNELAFAAIADPDKIRDLNQGWVEIEQRSSILDQTASNTATLFRLAHSQQAIAKMMVGCTSAAHTIMLEVETRVKGHTTQGNDVPGNSTKRKQESDTQLDAAEAAACPLRAWFFENLLHPFPTNASSKDLQHLTSMSRTNITGWFSNMRRRCGWGAFFNDHAKGDKKELRRLVIRCVRGVEADEEVMQGFVDMVLYVKGRARGKVGSWLEELIGSEYLRDEIDYSGINLNLDLNKPKKEKRLGNTNTTTVLRTRKGLRNTVVAKAESSLTPPLSSANGNVSSTQIAFTFNSNGSAFETSPLPVNNDNPFPARSPFHSPSRQPGGLYNPPNGDNGMAFIAAGDAGPRRVPSPQEIINRNVFGSSSTSNASIALEYSPTDPTGNYTINGGMIIPNNSSIPSISSVVPGAGAVEQGQTLRPSVLASPFAGFAGSIPAVGDGQMEGDELDAEGEDDDDSEGEGSDKEEDDDEDEDDDDYEDEPMERGVITPQRGSNLPVNFGQGTSYAFQPQMPVVTRTRAGGRREQMGKRRAEVDDGVEETAGGMRRMKVARRG